MAAGANEARRLLALDVRNLIWVGRFEAQRFIRTGFIAEWSDVTEYPDTPAMREAIRKAEEEAARQRAGA